MIKIVEAVIWDFGGVITSSPFEAFQKYEDAHQLPKDFIRSVNSINPDDNAWAKFERSEIDTTKFDELFRVESAKLGHEVSGRDILGLLSGRVRLAVVNALKVCKTRTKVGCITNNIRTGKGQGMSATRENADKVSDVFALFDHVIESSRIGIRKPDPTIYSMMCLALDVNPSNCIYIDDLGINLKPARALGMTTIKVLNEEQLLNDLSEATGYTWG